VSILSPLSVAEKDQPQGCMSCRGLSMQDVKVCSFEGSEDKKLCADWERYPSLSYSCRIVSLCSFRLLSLVSMQFVLTWTAS